MMQIHTRKDLELFRDLVNKGSSDIDAVLMSDIDITPESDDLIYSGGWNPIAGTLTPSVGYSGTFDGNGHTISGLNIIREKGSQGLFSAVSGTVRNLTVRGSIRGVNIIGGIAGSLRGGEILGCKSYVEIKGESNVGGICGFTPRGRIEGCSNYGTLTGVRPGGITGHTPLFNARGLAAISKSICITNCRNEGTIFISHCQPFEILKNNGYRYNQIGYVDASDRTNIQNGKVSAPFRDSMTGLFLNRYNFFDVINTNIDNFSDLIQNDPNPEYINERGETYLHLLCQNHTLHIGTCYDKINLREYFPKVLVMLASETNIDFGALDNNGHEATYYLRNSSGKALRGLAPIIKMIEEIKKDKERLNQQEQNETFSDIGF